MLRPLLAIIGQALTVGVLFYPAWRGAAWGWLAGVSFAVMFLTMAMVYWVLQIYKPRLPEGWFVLRGVERRGVYRWLGVPQYRAALARSPFAALNRDIRLSSRAGLPALARAMREAEAGHLIGVVLMAVLTLVFGALRDGRFFFWFSLFNMLGHVYPIWLQRYNRARVAAVWQRAAERD